MTAITIEDIHAAASLINVHRTPVATCSTLDAMVTDKVGQPVRLHFKCELLQKTGSFKFRGASNAVMRLTEQDAQKGVVTHSSGNHAQALALAAKKRGIPAYIVMPNNAPEVKKEAVRGYGAKIIECEPTQEAREAMAAKVIQETGATLIHPFENPHVIQGQGTIAMELLEQIGEQQRSLDALIVPVGGGGMLSGCSVATRALSPHTRIFAAEPEKVNDAYRTFESKTRQSNPPGTQSVADGLLTNLGEAAFSIVLDKVEHVFTVTEAQIIHAMQLVWSRMKLCIEPSAGVGVAVALYNPEFHDTVRKHNLTDIGIILCGGNVDITRAIKLFQEYQNNEQ